MARGLTDLDVPAFVWGTILCGEQTADPVRALDQIADRLEVESSLTPPADSTLHAFSLAFGRLGTMLDIGVPLLTALEAAADSLPDPGARKALLAARAAVRAGADLSDAVAARCPDLPEPTADMIRDAERDGRLPDALPVIADYLLDAAGDRPTGRRKQEASNA
jgi:type II secretory pathway component PulF